MKKLLLCLAAAIALSFALFPALASLRVWPAVSPAFKLGFILPVGVHLVSCYLDFVREHHNRLRRGLQTRYAEVAVFLLTAASCYFLPFVAMILGFTMITMVMELEADLVEMELRHQRQQAFAQPPAQPPAPAAILPAAADSVTSTRFAR